MWIHGQNKQVLVLKFPLARKWWYSCTIHMHMHGYYPLQCCCDSGIVLLLLCSSFCHCSRSVNHRHYCSQTWTLLEKLLGLSFSATGASFLLFILSLLALPCSYSSFLGLLPAGLLWYDNTAVYPGWTLRSLCTVLYPGPGARCRVGCQLVLCYG